jgi:hypothetical protein
MKIKELAHYIVENSGDIGCETAPEFVYENLLRDIDELNEARELLSTAFFRQQDHEWDKAYLKFVEG